MQEVLLVKKLDVKAVSFKRVTQGAAGYDISCLESFKIDPNERKLIRTGISIELPENSYGRIASRSGLACKGIDVCAGVVDQDYRGEIKVLLHNFSTKTHSFEAGNRIAQMIIEMIKTPEVEEVDVLSNTHRNDGGFGSTLI